MSSNDMLIVTAVIPAFNEESSLPEVLSSLGPHVTNIIVVDDCSSDATNQIALLHGACVLRNNINMGYEYSLDRGISFAYEQKSDIIITLDADGEHPPSMVQDLVNAVSSKECEVAIGARSKLPRVSERVFCCYSKIVYGIDDILSGMKCFSRHALSKSDASVSWNSVGTHRVLRCASLGMKIVSIPIRQKTRKDASRFGSGLRIELIILFALINSIFRI